MAACPTDAAPAPSCTCAWSSFDPGLLAPDWPGAINAELVWLGRFGEHGLDGELERARTRRYPARSRRAWPRRCAAAGAATGARRSGAGRRCGVVAPAVATRWMHRCSSHSMRRISPTCCPTGTGGCRRPPASARAPVARARSRTCIGPGLALARPALARRDRQVVPPQPRSSIQLRRCAASAAGGRARAASRSRRQGPRRASRRPQDLQRRPRTAVGRRRRARSAAGLARPLAGPRSADAGAACVAARAANLRWRWRDDRLVLARSLPARRRQRTLVPAARSRQDARTEAAGGTGRVRPASVVRGCSRRRRRSPPRRACRGASTWCSMAAACWR